MQPNDLNTPPSRRWKAAAGWFAVLLIAVVVRVQPWNDVFSPGREGAAFLGDSDTYYHALRAERIAHDYPRVPWHDAGMNFPLGSDILWPPLFDHTIATLAYVADGGTPTRATIETVAAVLPPVLGVITVGLVAVLGLALFGRGGWLAAGLLLAMLPAHVEYSVVGRPDQHAAELLMQVLVTLAFVVAVKSEPRGVRSSLASLAMGVSLALSFWNWQGSALYLILLAAFAAAWHLYDADGTVARRIGAVLAAGAGQAAVLLVVSIAVWGRPGALFGMSLSGINGIQALLAALVAAFALGLRTVSARRRGPVSTGRRAIDLVVCAAVPLAAAWLLIPGLRSGLAQGLLALTAGNPWYASIREFQPPLFGGAGIGHELKAWLPRFAPMFAMPLAAPALVRAWRARPEQRPALMFLAMWGGLLLAMTLARMRFMLYLSVPAALWVWLGLRELAEVLESRYERRRVWTATIVAGMVVLLAPAVFYFSHGGMRRDPTQVEVIGALEWLHDRPDHDPERIAVFSEWDWGHLIQYYGARPSVATPFGTDGGVGAMQDATAFFLTTSPEVADRILTERRAGHLLLVDPVTHAAESAAFAPSGVDSPVVINWHWLKGPQISAVPAVDDLIAVRIYFDNGLSARGLPTLDRYRLVYEGSPRVPRQVRLFEIVPGAELAVHHATPGAEVRAEVELRTHQGRSKAWYASSIADHEGTATLRVPFSTGENGAVTAGSYRVTCGAVQGLATISSAAVEQGARVEVRLPAVTLAPGP